MIFELNINYDKERLLLEAESVDYNAFKSGYDTGNWFDYAPTWMQGKVPNKEMYEETNKIKKFISNKINSNDIRPRFYKQEKNTEVPPHIDINTKCSVNIVLSDSFGPVQFTNYEPMFYSCALLDTTKEHFVPSYPEERLLLKFSIFDVTFDDAKRSFIY